MLYTQAQIGIEWSNNYGGSKVDYSTHGIRTSDSGYIIGGQSYSSDSNVSVNYGGRDAWIVKISNNGEIEWENSFGGSSYDYVHKIIETQDGGCFFAGVAYTDTTYSVSGSHGYYDGWLVKLDSAGNHEWHKCYGGANNDTFYDFLQLSDGSFVFVGSIWSNTVNGIPVSNHGNCDLWLLKTDSLGNIIWQHLYGGYHQDSGASLEQTPDGGFIICGTTLSDDGNVIGFNGFWDRWIVKTDSLGILEWAKCYGGTEADAGRDIIQSGDGGYIAIGESKSTDGHVSGNHGNWDAWVTRIDSVGNLLWERSLGGSDVDASASILQSIDEEYLVTAYTESIDGDVTFNHGMRDQWIVKLNDSGEINWQKCFGGSDDDGWGQSIEIAYDEYFVIGSARSSDGDVLSNYGSDDYWVMYLTCDTEPLSIDISDSMYYDSTELMAIGDFIEYKWNTEDTTQSITITSGGLYSVIAYTSDGCYQYAEIIAPDPIQPPFNGLEICMVTYDDTSAYNGIIYEPIHNVGIDTILFYVYDTVSNNFEWIGSNHIDDFGVFLDYGSNPDIHSYQYKVAIQDTFGNISDISPYHKTMYLSGMINPGNDIVLSWNPYIGFEYDGFEVHRSVDGGAYELIASTEDTFYSDQTASTGQVVYQVRVEKDTSCNPGNSISSHAASNPVVIPYVGLAENSMHALNIYPNPFDEEVIINRNSSQVEIAIDLLNIYGQNLGHFVLKPGQVTLRIPTTKIVSGIYFLRFNGTLIKRIIKH